MIHGLWALVVAVLVGTNLASWYSLEKFKEADRQRSVAALELAERHIQITGALNDAEEVHRREAEGLREAARRDLATAHLASSRLRDAGRVFANAACPDPAATGVREAAAAPATVLTDMLGGLDDAAGELAAALTEAHLAGLACERRYDEVRALQGQE